MPEPIVPEPPRPPEHEPGVAVASSAEPAAISQVPATGAEARRAESYTVLWLLASWGTAFVAAGWLLPWFVERTQGGVGFSPQDVVSSSPTGIGSVLVYLVGVAMLVLVVGLGWDLVITVRGGTGRLRYRRARAIAAVAGAAATLTIWVLIGVLREEPLFGRLSNRAGAGNALWMTLSGFVICALAYGATPLIIRRPGIAFAGIAFLFGGLVPFIFSGPNSTEFITWAAGSAAVYMLLALGLNVVVGFAGLLDLGYAAFFAIGAYTAGSLSSPRHGIYLPFWVLIFLGAAVAALFGAVLGAPTLRLRGDYLAIVTLGFGEILPDAAQNDILHQTGGPNGITGIHHPTIPFTSWDFGDNPRPYFWTILVLIGLVLLCLRNVERSRLGRSWVAVREDEVAAAATGVNTVSAKLLAFSIGAAVSGFAGAFYAASLGVVTPEDFRFQVSVTALTTVVLGGIGNIAGVAVGAFIISFIIFWVLPHAQEWSQTLGGTTGVTALSSIDYSKYVFVVYGLILIGMMLLRPAGLIPSTARKVELQAGTESAPLASVKGTM